MKTIFLGAGASKSAGYPASVGLMNELEDWADKSFDSSIANAWGDFSRFREKVSEPLRSVINSSDPEIILSAFDLMDLAREASRHDWWERGWKERPYPSDTEPSELPEAGLALAGFLRCLDSCFGFRHGDDTWQQRVRQKRAPLRDELITLKPGDVVITTNWDALAERILAEEGRWNPADGYGFSSSLKDMKTGLPPNFPPSEVKVLKLHGSVGWYRRGTTFYLRHAHFLQHLPIKKGEQDTFCRDDAEPTVPDPTDEMVLAYPSYLKKLNQPRFLDIWSQASDVMQRSGELHVIGYSLPPSDLAVRTLLAPIKNRLDSGDVSVTVDDPSGVARHSWQSFLGDRAQIRDRKLGSN